MESGLEGRNNREAAAMAIITAEVSMESGLEGRNNRSHSQTRRQDSLRLNGVRPRRPEQFRERQAEGIAAAKSQWSPA